jgi:hypothetical protein
MLNQIPDRLNEHAKRVGAELEGERQKLAAFQQDKLLAAGARPLQEKVAKAKTALDAIEAEFSRASQSFEVLDRKYDAIAGQDNQGAFTQAINLMVENDSRDDVVTLYREAARTKTNEDRAIVEKIDQLTKAIARADQEIAQLRGQIREVAAKRVEIQQVRNEFRQRGYDYPGTTFGNEVTINDILGGILEGAIKGAVLGQVLNQGYQRPPASNWGGGPARPGPMFPPSSMPPSSGRPSGGGFRTGGSF